MPKKSKRARQRSRNPQKSGRSTAKRTSVRKRATRLQRTRPGVARTAISPRQVAVRAQETAFQLITILDRRQIIPKFLSRYATEQKRPGRIADPARFRELTLTIRRETLLVLALHVEVISARRLSARASARAGDFDLAKLFQGEFYSALSRGLEHSGEEFGAFRRDLEVYRSLQRDPAKRQARLSMRSFPKGPFVDRCGFLLDSPMLEQARRAAAEFETELHGLASSIFQKVFSARSRV